VIIWENYKHAETLYSSKEIHPSPEVSIASNRSPKVAIKVAETVGSLSQFNLHIQQKFLNDLVHNQEQKFKNKQVINK